MRQDQSPRCLMRYAAEVRGIVVKMMAKKPEDRFQTPLELAAALAPFADESLSTAPTQDRAESERGATCVRGPHTCDHVPKKRP